MTEIVTENKTLNHCNDSVKVSSHGKYGFKTIRCTKHPNHDGLHGYKDWEWDKRQVRKVKHE